MDACVAFAFAFSVGFFNLREQPKPSHSSAIERPPVRCLKFRGGEESVVLDGRFPPPLVLGPLLGLAFLPWVVMTNCVRCWVWVVHVQNIDKMSGGRGRRKILTRLSERRQMAWRIHARRSSTEVRQVQKIENTIISCSDKLRLSQRCYITYGHSNKWPR